ncbi:MAG: hypothetical protein H7252_07780 [Cytophaga sp.]|nr:hypothetical protein [Undibacterium sp.]
MRTIIGFDSWTQGAHHFERLVSDFERRGFKLILIHVGSWGHDPNRPLEENIGKLLVRDIAYYDGLSFKEILLQERPEAVLFFSMQAFAHRAFNRYCRALGVPTVHLYHGLVNVQSTALKRLNPVNWRNQFALARTRFSTNILRILPNYARALRETDASWNDWTWLVNDIRRKITGTSYSSKAAPDASTSACCVFTNADIPHAVQRYGLTHESVHAVGNPDLIAFGLENQLIGCCLLSTQEARKDIIYIDTALIEAGAVFDGAGDFADHLNTTNKIVMQQGFQLVVKLHPAHFRTGVPERLHRMGIELCEKEEFVSRLKTATAAIVEPSSASMIPALMGLPLLLAQYGKLAEQQYGTVLTSYPRARFLKDIANVQALLAEERLTISSEKIHNWTMENVGPLPVEDMPERVGEIVDELIRTCHS